MKRDCGEGELIPTSWRVVSCIGKIDNETETKLSTKEAALEVFKLVVEKAKQIPHSDVRLYACDRQGYANCVLYYSQNGGGIISDRMSEL